MNHAFLKALGIVALCYFVLQALTWIATSLFSITQGLNYWLLYTLLPHAWQIAMAIGIIYLLLTAVTGRRGSY